MPREITKPSLLPKLWLIFKNGSSSSSSPSSVQLITVISQQLQRGLLRLVIPSPFVGRLNALNNAVFTENKENRRIHQDPTETQGSPVLLEVQ